MTDLKNARSVLVTAVVTCVLGAILTGPWNRAAIVAALVFGSCLAIAVAVAIRRHHRLAWRLRRQTRPAEIMGIPARVAPLAGRVFVAGLIRPEIYCDSALRSALDPPELEAVMLHERGHQRGRDPLRLAVLAAATPVLSLHPRGSALVARLEAHLEITADRYALQQGVSRTALASAVLKVAPTPIGMAGFRSATDWRLMALVGDDAEPAPSWKRPLAGVVVGLAICFVVIHRLG